jgi:hypothetical protein
VNLVFAHPASEVKANFDRAKGSLTISFDHKVKDLNDHFIYDLKVLVNKKEIINQKISKQENLEGGSLYYRLTDTKPTDKITIVTDCNKGGKKSITIDAK